MRTVVDACALAKEVKRILDDAAKGLSKKGVGNGEWTRQCLYDLAVYGKDHFGGVCPYPENMKGEWLYDLIWYIETDEDISPRRMKDVVLTLESEWSHRLWDIRYDFQKLIQAKSRLKVLVCEDLTDDARSSLLKDIETFEQKGDEIYMFASYNASKLTFECSTYNIDGGVEFLD